MVKAGIAGMGFMGWIHYLAYQRCDNVQLTAFCTRDEAKLNGDWTNIKGNFGPAGEVVDVSDLNTYSDLDELIGDPEIDLIDICLPPALHVDVAVAALNAGKHVLIEKPMALSTSECDEIVAAAQTNGKQALVAHVLPFFPEHMYLRGLVDSGEYGALLGGHFERVISDPLWLKDFWDMEKVGGPLVDLHVHDAHLIRVLFGMPNAVSTNGRMRGDVVEYFNSQFLFDDPSLVVSATSGVLRQQGRSFMHGYEVHFEQATVQFRSAFHVDEADISSLKIIDSQEQVIRPDLGDADEISAFVLEISEAANAIESGNASALLGGDLARDAIELCHAQAISAAGGEAVMIDN